ncbi:hypothetical protein DFH06DRAFT_1487720 [Mycena polygramma]|nr:hypothetical protein DFH06DRAFT_1487720 [Mycena polygramma]
MHRCLSILEIVDMISSHLAPRDFGVDKRDLAMVARTCTTFSDLALDYLWSSTELHKLLRQCMPADLWTVEIGRNALDPWDLQRLASKLLTARLLRPIRASDWDRFRLYARRVRILTSTCYDEVLVSNVLQLSVSLPGTMFPNLQALSWQHSGNEFYHIHLFLCPTLTAISFHLSSDSASSFLSLLPVKCPRLTKVTIRTLNSGYDSRVISEFVGSLQGVQESSVDCLEQDILENISHLPTLKSLSLRTLPTYTGSLVRGTPTFSALQDVSLGSLDIQPTLQFLRLCTAVPLKSFTVKLSELVIAGEMQDLLAAISKGVSPSTITRLGVGSECHDWAIIDVPLYLAAPPNSLRSLCPFGQLTCTVDTVTSLSSESLSNSESRCHCDATTVPNPEAAVWTRVPQNTLD